MMDTTEQSRKMKDSYVPPPTFDACFHNENDEAWIHKMPYRKLGNTEMSLSLLSYGGSSLGNYYSDNASHMESLETIQLAIKSGVNYIETGPWYGPSEKIIGEAIRDLPRNTFYISTKAGRYFTPGWENRFDFSANKVLKSVEASLNLLGLQYVDIIQIHDIEFCLDQNILLKETLPALESVVKAGKAKYIGITSYCLESMKTLVERSPVKIDSILSYCRYNFHDTALEASVPYFQSKNVGVINASPVAMGLYTQRGPPQWHPSSQAVKSLAKQACQLTQSKGVSIETAALGFALRPQNTYISSTLVSMPSKDILHENLKIVTDPYTKEDEKLYSDVIKLFEEGLNGENGHWEGVELKEYKNFLDSKH